MLITLFIFLLAGFWHGPSWTFIFFGFLHGIAVIFNHLLSKFFNFNLGKVLSIFLTFNYVNITFIFFRLENINDSILLLKKMFLNFNQYEILFLFQKDIIENNLHYLTLIFSFFIIFFLKNSNQINLDKILSLNEKKNI